MCGIAGIVRLDGGTVDRRALERMTQALVHRGPDGQGIHIRGPVGFGHRRLAIIDPAHGQQPFVDDVNGDTLTYNGELYNYIELRRELDGMPFGTDSDTEVLLRGLQKWGREALPRFAGMYAFAHLDPRSGRVLLARDRLGIKPLYYFSDGAQVLFASELRALLASGMVPRDVDPDALAGYLRYGHVPTPHTIYRGVRKLEPGCCLVIDPDEARTSLHRYWRLVPQVRERPEAEALEELEALLGEIIAMHVRSDVPFGAFLSGGLDSSVVAACMARAMPEPPRCFTIGFRERTHDEVPYARQAAEAIGARLRVEHVTVDMTASLLGELARIYGEPFADSSAIPTWYVARMAAAEVKMVLSGDGGDELFAGYNSHADVWHRLRSREPAGPSRPDWQFLHHNARDTFHADARRRLMGTTRPEDDEEIACPAGLDPVGRCQARDLRSYLPDDILTKVDRASMAHSLEVRVPLLDHRLVEFAFNLPTSLKLARQPDGSVRGKHLLKLAAERFFPPAAIDRPKMGFGIPIQAWLDGPLRPLVQDLLVGSAAPAIPWLDDAEVRSVVRGYYDRTGANVAQVWLLLMLRLWLDEVHRA
ncbi:asparagine synthase (glutamine-hydrolyzing) [Azospirillum sp. sgz302134]